MLDTLLKSGILVEPAAFEKIKTLDSTKIKTVVECALSERPLLLTPQLIDIYLTGPQMTLLSQTKQKPLMQMQEMISMMQERFEFCKQILQKRIVNPSKLVSISNCSGDATLIGMLAEKRGNEIRIEDGTGSLQLITNDQNLLEDDVIAVEGKCVGKNFFVDRIIYPDVPIRPVVYSKNEATVSLNGNSDFVFTATNVNHRNSNRKIEFSQPTLIEISGVTILLMLGHDHRSALHRRFIPGKNWQFLIDKLPDIVLTDSVDKVENYKSITVAPEKTVINLKTRTVL